MDAVLELLSDKSRVVRTTLEIAEGEPLSSGQKARLCYRVLLGHREALRGQFRARGRAWIVQRAVWPERDAAQQGHVLTALVEECQQMEERLAACVNLLPAMESVYRWEGRVEHETERQVVIKTSRERVVALWDRVRELHPYEVPEFIVLPIIDGNEAYLRWVGESTSH